LQHLTKQIPPIELVGTVADLLTLPLAALAQLPESLIEIAVIRCAMNQNLLGDFSARWLSPLEQQLLAQNQGEVVPESLREKWDQYLLGEAAQQNGAGILLSDHVMARVWAWACGEMYGSRKLNRLFNQIHKSVRVRLRLGKGSVTDQTRQAMDDFVPEIAELQNRLRNEWPESLDEIRVFIEKEIETSPRDIT
jgi:hypothetical protein